MSAVINEMMTNTSRNNLNGRAGAGCIGRAARVLALFIGFTAATGAMAAGPTFVLKAGRVYTMTEGEGWIIDRGMVFVKDGKIEAVGADLEVPKFVDVIDMPDAVIMPGLVCADSWLSGQNLSQDSVGPQYRAIDAYNPYQNYERVLAGGVTTVYLNPGRHRLVSGVGAVVKLGERDDAAVLDESADLVINLGEAAFDPPNKEHWLVPPSSDFKIRPDEVQRPTSRLGQFLQLNESFDAAVLYGEALRAPKTSATPEFDVALDALATLIQKKSVLRMRADRATDLEQAIAFCEKRKHAFVLSGGREISRVARKLIGKPIGVVFEVPVDPTVSGEDLGANPDVLGDELSIDPALEQSRLAIVGSEGAPHGELMFYAALAQGAGLSHRKALEAVTSDAAKILGVDGRVGSLKAGLDADLVVLNGEPLRGSTSVRQVFVGGRLRFDAEKVATDALVIKAGRAWTGDRWISPGAVLIENGRIVSVGETASQPPYARVIDAGDDAVLTPGFIDARGHLGCEGDHTSAGADASIAQTLYNAGPEFERVARAGVTTVFTSAYRPGGTAARVSAIHTAGENPEQVVVKETAGLLMALNGPDAEAAVNRLKSALSAAKKYDDAWKKYEKELEEYKNKGAPKIEEKKEPEKKPEAEDKKEKPPEDPVTGTWEGEVSGAPLPEAQGFIAKMKLTGDQVEGSLETIFGGGESVGIRGTYREKHLSLEVDVEIPIGKAMIEADVDRDDHLTGILDIAGRFQFDLEATRTEKSVPEIKITRKRKKKGDGGPEAPRKDDALEPFRDLLAGRIPLVLDVDSRMTMEAVLPVFEKEYKVPFMFLNAPEARLITRELAAAKVGVIVQTRPVESVNDRDYVQAADLSRAGIPIAFQSDGEDSARLLPIRVAYTVRRGLDATAALRALTGDAAKLHCSESEVGFLKNGCRGDVLIFNGPPLEPATRLQRVIINGREVKR